MDPADRLINFQFKHGSNKFNASLPASSLLSEVIKEAEKITGVPSSSQKLIINGKALTSLDHNKPITECRIQDGTKIMVLGKRYDPESDSMYQKVVAVEQLVTEAQKKLSEVAKEVKDIEDGFLPKEHHSEALKGLSKRCNMSVEEFMSSLEVLDGLQFGEHQNIAKSKRKSVVNLTNSNLDNADDLLQKIDSLTKK